MFRDPVTRRKLAILAIFLGIVFISGVLWSVLTGDADWWTLILILPAAAIMRKLSKFVTLAPGSPARRNRSLRQKDTGSAPPGDHLESGT